jgi:hypothetical protein
VFSVLLTAEGEDGIELDGNPARFVTPVLEKRLAGLKELLGERPVEAFEAGQKEYSVAA